MPKRMGVSLKLPARFRSGAGSSTPAAADPVLFLGRCLSYDHSERAIASLRRELSDPLIDWLKVIDGACRNAITPALWSAMARKELMDQIPADLQRYLALIHSLNRQRNEIIRQEACQAISALIAGGLRPVLMKGSFVLFDDRIDRGLCMMTDIDILLPDEAMEKACSVLSSTGYSLFGRLRRSDRVHAWTLHRPGSLVTIDLHRHVGPQRDVLSTEIALGDAIPSPGESAAWGLCPTHSALLQIMTFAIFERFYRLKRIPMRGLHDLALLCHRHQDEIDWHAIVRVATVHDFAPAAHAFVHMARHIFAAPIPSALGGTASSHLYFRQCLLHQSSPGQQRAIRVWNRLAWPLDRFRMHYRYECGTRGPALHLARLRHVAGILRRRLGWRTGHEARI